MQILIVGGTGFIGRYVAQYYLERGHKVVIQTRVGSSQPLAHLNLTYVHLFTPDLACDLVINLAGMSLNQRWTGRSKVKMLKSRVETTETLVKAISQAKIRPKMLLSASAVGFYGTHPALAFTEDSAPASEDFTSQLCQAWEEAAEAANAYGVQVALLRFGVVIGKDGGILQQLLPFFKRGLGAIMGQGSAYLSWISLDDLVRALEYICEQPQMQGAWNLTAPEPCTHREFSRTLASVCHKPLLLRVPGWVIALGAGEMGREMILKGQKALPARLLEAGFRFRYTNIHAALNDLV